MVFLYIKYGHMQCSVFSSFVLYIMCYIYIDRLGVIFLVPIKYIYSRLYCYDLHNHVNPIYFYYD